MNKGTQLLPFVQDLFEDRAVAEKATRIVDGILRARSPLAGAHLTWQTKKCKLDSKISRLK